ncbi:MAG: M42 family metallopeptidase [Chloroflexota bacterium]|nr:M42 family metallopeptidase [Chloroflexota bacterium]
MNLQALSDAVGISGKEDAIRALILPAIKDHAEQIRIDPLGSITAIKAAKRKRGAKGKPPRVLIAAHMDEVGFMINGIDGDGLIRFTPIGGIDDRILPGLRVRIGDALLPGVIIWTPIHKSREQNMVKLKDLRIDIGAANKDEANGKVKLGDRVAFDSKFMEIGDHTLRGKALDDRAGCSLLIDLLAGDPFPVDLLAAFTVQEEIGLRGAQVAAQTLLPDIALVLETTTAQDIPNPKADPDDENNANPVCKLGAGPVLTVIDRSMIVHPPLLNFIRATAESAGIAYQLKTQPGGGTDGGAIHTAAGGIPTAVLSLPARYIHSPAAYIRRADYDALLKLVRAVLGAITLEAVRAQ